MNPRFSAPLMLLLLATACGGSSQPKTIIGRDGSKTEITETEDGGSTMVTTATDGSRSVVTTRGGWPIDAPDFAAAYPGAQVTSSAAGGDGRTKGGSVSFATSDSPDQVVAFYRSQASAAQIEEASGAEQGDTRVFGANDRAGGRALGIRVKADGSVTRVTMTYSMREP